MIKIKECHNLQNMLTLLPRDRSAIELTLYSSERYRALYFWRDDSYKFYGPGQILIITECRLQSFGCQLKTAQWSEQLIQALFDYIADYEQGMPENRRGLQKY